MICGVRCPLCARPVPDAASSCPACGARLSPSAMATVTSPGGVAATPLPTPHSSARTAGTILAGRYRIVGLLGRGGMGEVYRADDLTLGQPVALKFLPASAAADPAALARFHNEVRIARQVSHPNVCRIHDLGEADGEPFLSMEYVDGEDLSSLLRRIGRLAGDKAVESARQLCSGLAAAHDMGVLHRDLKPANVMLDGRGVVKITDFGLANFSEQIARDDIAGTPAYMAPEQLAGRAATIGSDLYALGLVLFEMFTGVAAFAPGSAADRARSSADSAPPTPSSARPDIDPAVERVIVRCLDPDPARRPPSARVVGAALPGGDPLAAALAAGQTPSPQMVADAATLGRLRPAVAWALLASLAIGMAAVGAINDRAAPYRASLLELSPEVLRVRAAQILDRAGRSGATRDWAAGFEFDPDVAAFLRRDGSAGQWRRAESRRPGLIRFWYRESEWWVIPWSMMHLPTSLDPPPTEAGAIVLLDRDGNLQRLTTILAPGTDLPPSAVAARLVRTVRGGRSASRRLRSRRTITRCAGQCRRSRCLAREGNGGPRDAHTRRGCGIGCAACPLRGREPVSSEPILYGPASGPSGPAGRCGADADPGCGIAGAPQHAHGAQRHVGGAPAGSVQLFSLRAHLSVRDSSRARRPGSDAVVQGGDDAADMGRHLLAGLRGHRAVGQAAMAGPDRVFDTSARRPADRPARRSRFPHRRGAGYGRRRARRHVSPGVERLRVAATHTAAPLGARSALQRRAGRRPVRMDRPDRVAERARGDAAAGGAHGCASPAVAGDGGVLRDLRRSHGRSIRLTAVGTRSSAARDAGRHTCSGYWRELRTPCFFYRRSGFR